MTGRTRTETTAISIHAPREGGDRQTPAGSRHWSSDFNPRPPRGGRRLHSPGAADPLRISIHAPREGGDSWNGNKDGRRWISIHAPREGGDVAVHSHHVGGGISIHAPREGGDQQMSFHGSSRPGFQSTPPARGATFAHPAPLVVQLHFQSPPPARGATRGGI